MATYDLTLNSTTYPVGGTPTPRYKGVQVLTSRVVELASRANAANVYDLFDLPAGTVVLGGHLTVIEPANTTMSIDVGITGTDTDCYIDGCDVTAAAGTNYKMVAGTEAYFVGTVGGNSLASATTVSALQTATTVLTAGKFVVSLIVAGIN